LGFRSCPNSTSTNRSCATCAHLEAIRDGAGQNADLLLDPNFNAKTEGYLKILRAIADFQMFWVEIDSYSPTLLGHVRRQSPHPISSCETLLRLRESGLFPRAVNGCRDRRCGVEGVWQSMKIAAAADAHEVNIAPHNFYGHLATMMNAHFAVATPNLRSWKSTSIACLGTRRCSPRRRKSRTDTWSCPTSRGWGTEPNEDGIRAHEPRAGGGLLNYRQS
jgi:L-alanine-DL-glutamate epimerase-like enolase superfamily enzyme